MPPTVVPDSHTGPPAPASEWRPLRPDSLRKTGPRLTPVASGQLQATTASRQHEERPPRWPLVAGAVVVVAVAASIGVYMLKRAALRRR